MVDETSKDKALAAALSQIERQFGKGSMMRLGDSEREAIPSISTGSLGIDVGAWHRRLTERTHSRDLRP